LLELSFLQQGTKGLNMIDEKKLKRLLDSAPEVTEKKKRKFILEELKQEVKDRDSHKCVVCGREKDLKAHHIIPYGESSMDNLVTVCGYCHEYIHKILKRKGYYYVSPLIAMKMKQSYR